MAPLTTPIPEAYDFDASHSNVRHNSITYCNF